MNGRDLLMPIMQSAAAPPLAARRKSWRCCGLSRLLPRNSGTRARINPSPQERNDATTRFKAHSSVQPCAERRSHDRERIPVVLLPSARTEIVDSFIMGRILDQYSSLPWALSLLHPVLGTAYKQNDCTCMANPLGDPHCAGSILPHIC